jgi:hypothetical protein
MDRARGITDRIAAVTTAAAASDGVALETVVLLVEARP